VIVLYWYTKTIVRYYAGIRCTAQHWLSALDMAVNGQFPGGARGKGLSLMSANGCQPTSTSFMRACGTFGVQQAFTGYNNSKANADTKRVMRTLKEECLWLQEWTCPFTVVSALEMWIGDHNEHYLHSTLGYNYRGRDAGHPAPPAQIRTCGTPAYGPYLGCMASKRTLGNDAECAGWESSVGSRV
jgi:putative transposase